MTKCLFRSHLDYLLRLQHYNKNQNEDLCGPSVGTVMSRSESGLR